MGNLTTLFTEIFKSLVENGQLKILNYNNLLSDLKNREITAFGGQTQCIDSNFDRIIYYLNDQTNKSDGNFCKEIFKLLVGELRPIPQIELSKIISEDDIPVEKLINTINNDIKEKDKIERSIIKVAPLKSDISLDDLISILEEQEYVKDHKTFVISSIKYSESIEEFKERVVSYELNDELKLIPKVFLPIDKADTKAIFEDLINDDGASELNNVF